MKYHRIIFLSFFLILQFGCIHKTANRSSPDSDDLAFTTPPQLKCASTPSAKPKFIKGGALTGGRSRASIMRGIMPMLGQLRKLYNREYSDSCVPTLKIVVFFKIDHLGNVVSCEVSKSNSGDPKFDSAILLLECN